MTTHTLKIWPEYFKAVIDGSKTWELRKADHPFAVGDTLRLLEWCPAQEERTGRECEVKIVGVLHAKDLQGMLHPDYCLLLIGLGVDFKAAARSALALVDELEAQLAARPPAPEPTLAAFMVELQELCARHGAELP